MARGSSGISNSPTRKKASKTSAARKQEVPSSSLAWSAVPLPVEATAQAGQIDTDFFQGFSYDDDDFMGLTEVSGVEVIRDKDGIVKFAIEKDGPNKATKGKGKAFETEDRKQKKDEPIQKKNKGQIDQKHSSSTSSQSLDEELPHIQFEEEDVGIARVSETIGGQLTSQEESINANFSLLAEEIEGGLRNSVKWTNKNTIRKLPEWSKMGIQLHPLIYQSLHSLKFERPTSIQEATLPVSIPTRMAKKGENRDIIGVAQTGSGKTLAYGLPILHWIASNPYEDRQMRLLNGVPEEEIASRLTALILTPTRELALQVSKHLNLIVEHSSSEKNRWASVATITGGMSEDKQRRKLQGHRGRGVDIIVATPGRFWELCRGDDALARRIKTTRFLVIDEADRMIENGHFAEMQNIFALVQRSKDALDQRSGDVTGIPMAQILGGAQDMQTFIFSATLSKDLQHNLKRGNRLRRQRKGQNASTLGDLLEAIDFRDDEPFMIDQSTSTQIANDVMEVKAECLAKDKDLYLYYFLLRYPGRTLVFVNAIDGIRRLQPFLENLQFSVYPLHSQLQQRQRLKNMDRFRNRQKSIGGSSILLATDVAARGLDIPAVDHVVHFQIPRTADTYVHRSGRTARAGREGVSLALIEPSQKRVWQDLCKHLHRKDDLSSMPIEYTFLSALKERVALAKQIDQAIHTQNKVSHDDAWLRKLAKEAEMELSEEDETQSQGTSKVLNGNKNLQGLRYRLAQLIQTPLHARGISAKYITSGDRDFVNSLLDDRQHESLIGLQKTTLHDHVKQAKTKEGQMKKRKRV